jgi:peroxin-1
LKDLVARAIHQVAMRAINPGVQVSLFHFESRVSAKKLEIKSILTQSDFANAQVDFVPLSLRDIKLEKSDITWSDIGGALTS